MTSTVSRKQNVRKVCISQQMQWTTSLVTLTPSSGPGFIDETKLNSYPSLNTHKHRRWSSSKSSRRLIQQLRWRGQYCGCVWARSCCVSRKLTSNRAENVYGLTDVCLQVECTGNPETNISTTTDLCRLWMAGHGHRVPSVSRQWAQSRLWPQWLWHLAGCCNLSASQSDSKTNTHKVI